MGVAPPPRRAGEQPFCRQCRATSRLCCMRLPRTRAERKPRALLDELVDGFVESLEAVFLRLGHRGGGLDVGEPHRLARLPQGVDERRGRRAKSLDGLLGFGGDGFFRVGHGLVWLVVVPLGDLMIPRFWVKQEAHACTRTRIQSHIVVMLHHVVVNVH